MKKEDIISIPEIVAGGGQFKIGGLYSFVDKNLEDNIVLFSCWSVDSWCCHSPGSGCRLTLNAYKARNKKFINLTTGDICYLFGDGVVKPLSLCKIIDGFLEEEYYYLDLLLVLL